MSNLWITEVSVEKSYISKKETYFPFLSNTPLCRQLQHLSAYLLDNDDSYLCTSIPYDQKFFHRQLIDNGVLSKNAPYPWVLKPKLPYQEVKTWGWTPQITRYAKEICSRQNTPPIAAAKKWSDKSTLATLLDTAQIFTSLDSIKEWILCSKQGVLKAPFGAAGKGHFFFNKQTNMRKLNSWIKHKLSTQGELLLEPQLDVEFNFSTLWNLTINEAPKYIGYTEQIIDAKGVYLGTRIHKKTPAFIAPFLKEHLQFIHPFLNQIQDDAYYGPVCFDAFVYKKNGQQMLRPISEVNMRHSMGGVAIKLAQNASYKEYAELFYSKDLSSASILPKEFKGNDNQLVKAPLSLNFKLF